MYTQFTSAFDGGNTDGSSDTPNVRQAADDQTLQSDPSQQSADESSDETFAESRERNSSSAPSEFQQFVASSTGRLLPIFGASFFKMPFPRAAGVPAPADYIVGPDDEIILRVWGHQNFELMLQVDRNGEVFIPEIGSVSIAGLPYRELKEHLKTQLERIFENFDLSVNMGQLRSIQIYVAGNAARTGMFTVSSLSTMVNALFVSGGPLPQGSMRRVQLRRNGRLVTELDLYDLLLKGDKTGDARLEPEDVIYIPVVGAQIAVAGSVTNPAIYEIKNEKTVGEIIEMAGGFTPIANRERARMERIIGGVSREVVELSLNGTGKSEPVADGDLIQVFTIGPRFDNAVTLRGNVAGPGRFAWNPGMRLRDIIPNKESLITSNYWNNRNMLGNIPGASAIPVRTIAETAVADINWSFALIERLNPTDLLTNFIPFHLGKLVLENDESQNLELRSGDVVTIFSQADIRTPQMQQTRTIRLEGEFNAPGIYIAGPNETLGQIIAKAGGLTPQAYLFGAEFARVSTRRDQQTRMENYIVDLQQEADAAARSRLANAADNSEAAMISTEIENRRRTIERMRTLRSTGRIVLSQQPGVNDISEIAGLTLEDGDVFTVPARPSVINVIGEVYNPNAFIHVSGRRVKEYLELAGGFTRNADEKRAYIIRADGSVLPRQSVSGFDKLKLNPGDSLVIPEHLFKTTVLRELRNWSQVFSQFGLGIAAINVLR
jgi:protein involved in polysaccharide export with SLBB domain